MKRTCIQSVLQRVSRHPALPVGLVLSSRRFLPGSGFPAWVPTQPDLGPGPNHRPRTSPHRTSHQASSLFTIQSLSIQFCLLDMKLSFVENLLALKDGLFHALKRFHPKPQSFFFVKPDVGGWSVNNLERKEKTPFAVRPGPSCFDPFSICAKSFLFQGWSTSGQSQSLQYWPYVVSYKFLFLDPPTPHRNFSENSSLLVCQVFP